jgi:hypothetical protein
VVKEREFVVIYDNMISKKGEIYYPNDLNCIHICGNEILILDDLNKPSLYRYDRVIKQRPIEIGINEEIYPTKYESFNKFIVNKEIQFPIYQKGIYYSETQYLKYFDTDFSTNMIIEDIFYGYGLKNISQFDEKSGAKTWQFSIQDFPPYINGFFREQEADIKQIIGVYNNLLWIHVGGFRLVGIDINTGKMIHLIKDVLKGENGNNFLDIKNGTLKTLSYDYYAKFDLQTLQFRKQTTVEGEADIKVRASSFYEGDKCLYFCGYHDNKFDKPNAFGIFDTEKAEIIWYDITKDDLGYFYNPPQANDKLLAILDDKHNLLVYERYNEVNKLNEI